VTFYELDGAYGAPIRYSIHGKKHAINWWYILAAGFVVVMLGLGLAVNKTFASVQPVLDMDVPQVVAQPPVKRVTPVAAVVEVPDNSAQLTAQLQTWATAQNGSDWGFYVKSLDASTPLSVGVGASQTFQMASIYKLFLLKPLASKLPSEAWGSSYVTNRTYLDCVNAMLAVSDNPCAEAIAGGIGWNPLHRQVQLDGYKQTVLNSSDNFVSTPSDAGLLLERLYKGEGYDAKTREIALAAMGKTKSAEAIRRGCSGCTVQNKTGDLGGYKHDAAIVEKGGKPYVVIVFSKGAAWSQLVEASKIISNNL